MISGILPKANSNATLHAMAVGSGLEKSSYTPTSCPSAVSSVSKGASKQHESKESSASKVVPSSSNSSSSRDTESGKVIKVARVGEAGTVPAQSAARKVPPPFPRITFKDDDSLEATNLSTKDREFIATLFLIHKYRVRDNQARAKALVERQPALSHVAERVELCGQSFSIGREKGKFKIVEGMFCQRAELCERCEKAQRSSREFKITDKFMELRKLHPSAKFYRITLTVRSGKHIRTLERILHDALKELKDRAKRNRLGRRTTATAFEFVIAAVCCLHAPQAEDRGQYQAHFHLVALAHEKPDETLLREEWSKLTKSNEVKVQDLDVYAKFAGKNHGETFEQALNENVRAALNYALHDPVSGIGFAAQKFADRRTDSTGEVVRANPRIKYLGKLATMSAPARPEPPPVEPEATFSVGGGQFIQHAEVSFEAQYRYYCKQTLYAMDAEKREKTDTTGKADAVSQTDEKTEKPAGGADVVPLTMPTKTRPNPSYATSVPQQETSNANRNPVLPEKRNNHSPRHYSRPDCPRHEHNA